MTFLEDEMPGFERETKILQVLAVFERAGGRAHVRVIARALWPASPLWAERAKRAGANGLREDGPKLLSAAAGLVGRLCWFPGLVRAVEKGVYEITDRGRERLARATAAVPVPPAPSAPPWPWPPRTRVAVYDPRGAYWAFVLTTQGWWALVQPAGVQWCHWIEARTAAVA
jgi:hypothetical protein